MGRPVAYYFKRVDDKIYDVHAMGNPFLPNINIPVSLGKTQVNFTGAIKELVKPIEGLDYITGLTKPQIRKLAEVEVIQLGLFDQVNLVE